MKSLQLRRIATGKQGTFGVLKFQDLPFAVTLERQWDNNRPSVLTIAGACILAGEYICNRVNSPRFGDTFEVMDVPDRSHILFHKGNLDEDSRGCILVAESYGQLGGEVGVLGSKHGYNEFMNLMSQDDEFRLIIVDDFMTELLKE